MRERFAARAKGLESPEFRRLSALSASRIRRHYRIRPAWNRPPLCQATKIRGDMINQAGNRFAKLPCRATIEVMAIFANVAALLSNSALRSSGPELAGHTLPRLHGPRPRGYVAVGGRWASASFLALTLLPGCASEPEDESAKVGIDAGKTGKTDKKKSADDDDSGDTNSPVDDGAKDKLPDDLDEPKGKNKDNGPSEGSTLDECDKIDLVFVIDDSRSMKTSQESLIADFPNFIKVLDAYRTKEGKPLDYRISVTTSSVSHTMHPLIGPAIEHKGDDGRFRAKNGVDQRECLEKDAKWIEHDDPKISERFSCVAEVGTEGLGIEMQMLALNLSVSARITDGDNKGFLRKDALLAAVILTDEDDCSVEDQDLEPGFNFTQCLDGVNLPEDVMKPERSIELLDKAKQNERARWALGVLVNENKCTPGPNGPQPGAPKKRLKGLTDAAGDNAVYVPICEGKFAESLNKVLDTFTEACQEFPPPK